jgi:hypothetical protein
MTNLGDKLCRIEAEQAAQKAKFVADEQGRRENIEKQRKEEIRKFLANSQNIIELEINSGNPSPTFALPNYIETNGTFTIMDTRHRDHSYFAEFQAWAQANGLQIVGVCSDSGGKSGFKFYVVSIQRHGGD